MKNSINTLGLSLLLCFMLVCSAAYGQNNTAYGTNALTSVTTGVDDSAFGYNALEFNTSGTSNSAVGFSALFTNTTGSFNDAFGYFAVSSNTTGNSNTGFGAYSVLFNTTGKNNTGLGYGALQAVTTGSNNTGAGYEAGYTFDGSSVTGKNNTSLGASALLGTGTLNNATAVGAWSEVDASNSLVLGTVKGANGQTKTVNVGIGTTKPDNNLTVNGTADKPGGGSWGTYSDGRLKNLDGNFRSGLSQILQINPVRYRYKPDNAMGIQDPDEHVGLVAQDVQKVIPEAVTKNENGYLLVNNDPIIWAMLNAIKQQQALIQQQQEEIEKLTSRVKTIQASMHTN